MISIVTKSQLLSSQIAVVATFLPAFLLSGFIFTIANMPRAIQMVTYLVPARYFVAVLKGIYLKGVGLEILAGQVDLAGHLRRRDGVVGASEVQEEADVGRAALDMNVTSQCSNASTTC